MILGNSYWLRNRARNHPSTRLRSQEPGAKTLAVSLLYVY